MSKKKGRNRPRKIPVTSQVVGVILCRYCKRLKPVSEVKADKCDYCAAHPGSYGDDF